MDRLRFIVFLFALTVLTTDEVPYSCENKICLRQESLVKALSFRGHCQVPFGRVCFRYKPGLKGDVSRSGNCHGMCGLEGPMQRDAAKL